MTRQKADLVRVHLDNGQAIDCTPDHRFLLRDGSYLAAEDLAEGCSLMPFSVRGDKDGYPRVQQNYSGRWQRVHWLVARSGLLGDIPCFDGQKTVIHHLDFNEQNNDPSNLQFMGDADHSAYHRSLVERNEHWQSEEFEARRKAALTAKAETTEGHAFYAERGSRNLVAAWATDPDGMRATVAERNRQPHRREQARQSMNAWNAAPRMCECPHCGRNIKCGGGCRNHVAAHVRRGENNHKVVRVERLAEQDAVYCLHVPGLENFALAAGVFVHNCRMKLSITDLPPSVLGERHDSWLEESLHRGTVFGLGGEYKDPQHHPVLDEDWNVTKVTAGLKDKARKQLGTSGTGNHFVEWGIVEIATTDLGIEPGSYVALLSHSGSRGPGGQTCEHYSRLARRLLPPRLADKFKFLAWLSMDREEGQDYWAAMNLMGKFAEANHAVIHRNVLRQAGAQVIAGVENHHNFAWEEELDGEKVYVHRKGATPAAPGVMGFIPGSMADPGFIVKGKGGPGSINSSSHGAGRRMSRTAAREAFTWKQWRPILAERKVTLLSAGLDEMPGSYKDIRAVMAAQTDLVDVVGNFHPRVVKMAEDGKAED